MDDNLDALELDTITTPLADLAASAPATSNISSAVDTEDEILASFLVARPSFFREVTITALSPFQPRNKETRELIPVVPGQEQSYVSFTSKSGKPGKAIIFNNAFPSGIPLQVGLSPIPARFEIVENVSPKDGKTYRNVIGVAYNASDLHINDIVLMSRVGFKLS